MMSTKVLFGILANFLIIFSKVNAVCEYEYDGAYIAHPESRHMFYYCWDGIGYEGECHPGQEFDPFYRVCTNIQENWDVPSCDRIPNGVILADPSSDRNFFICFNGLPHRVQCHENEVFDAQTQECAPLRSGGRTSTQSTTKPGASTTRRTTPQSTPRTTTVRIPPTRTTVRTTTRQPTRTTRPPATRTTTRQTAVPTRTTTRNIATRSTTSRLPPRQ